MLGGLTEQYEAHFLWLPAVGEGTLQAARHYACAFINRKSCDACTHRWDCNCLHSELMCKTEDMVHR